MLYERFRHLAENEEQEKLLRELDKHAKRPGWRLTRRNMRYYSKRLSEFITKTSENKFYVRFAWPVGNALAVLHATHGLATERFPVLAALLRESKKTWTEEINDILPGLKARVSC